MNDIELIQMAAKAAGIQGRATENVDEFNFWLTKPDSFGGRTWAPLTDDGDALRLAVKLRLTVSWDRFDDGDYATATPRGTHQGYDCAVDQDPYAATRRAIVRAAAEIGKAMK